MRIDRTWFLAAALTCAGFGLGLGLGSGRVARAGEPAPWETAPLTAPPEDVRGAVAAVPLPAPGEAEHGLHYLEDDHLHELSSDGRVAYTRHQVYRIVGDAGVESAGIERVSWRPWFEERPEIEARVLAADGAVHVLSPDTIAEQPVAAESGTLTDARQLVAPLPALSPGAIVEVRVRQRERQAPFTSGRASGFLLGMPNPTERLRFRFRVAADVPFHWVARGGAALTPTDERTADGREVTFLLAPAPREAIWEPATPRDDSSVPLLYWSTGASWQAVAEEYGRLVDAQLAGADVQELAGRLAGDATDPAALAERFLAHVRSQLRYTGLEFGAAALVPAPPAVVLQRRYGDCKDLAALLVALFRARGVEAHVALLRAGSGLDVAEELPSLDPFDHAIVHVSGPSELWLDPTAPRVPMGQLPTGDQGRRALVAAAGTTGLVTLPSAEPTTNSVHILRTVHLTHDGPGDVSHELTAGGAIGSAYRDGIAADPEGFRRAFEDWGRRELEAGGEVAVTIEAPEGRDPVTLRVTAQRSGLVDDVDNGATVSLPIWFLFDGLPEPLTTAFATDSAEARRWRSAWLERKHDLVVTPQVREVDYRIVPPSGFVVTRTPPQLDLGAGPVRVTSRVQRGDAGVVDVLYRLETGAGRLTPAETRELHEELVALSKTSMHEVEVRYEPDDLLQRGRTDEALHRSAELARANADVPYLRAAFAEMLIRVGLPDAGASVAGRVVRDFPQAAHPALVLGWGRMHGDLGDWLGPGNDREGAIEAFRALVELPSAGAPAFYRLAEACALDDRGRFLGPGSDAACALAALERLRAAFPEDGRGDAFYLRLLVAEGRFQEALALAPTVSDSLQRSRAWVRALAATGPADAVLERAAALASDEEQHVMLVMGAAVQLVALDRVDAAVDLLDAAVERRPEWREAFAAMRNGLTDTPPDPAPAVPCALFQDFSNAIYYGDDETLFARVPDHLHGELTELRDRLAAPVRKQIDTMMDSLGFSFRDLAPLALFNDGVPCQVEGSRDEGYFIQMAGTAKWGLFVRSDGDDDWAIIPPTVAALASEALAAAEAGRPAAARAWLLRADHALSFGRSVGFRYLVQAFSGGDDPAGLSDEAVTAVAACLALPVVPDALARAEAAFRALEDGPRKRFAGVLLLNALGRVDRAEDLLRLAPEVRTAGASDESVLPLEVGAHRILGHRDEWHSRIDAALTGTPEARAWRAWMLATELYAEGPLDRARALLEEARRAAPDDRVPRNELAWMALFDGGSLPGALDLVGEPGDGDDSAMHTRATLLAWLDRPAEAIEWLHKSIRARGLDAPQPHDLLVLGRLAEGLGAYRAAAAAYAGVTPDDPPALTSSHTLAQRAMEELDERTDGLD